MNTFITSSTSSIEKQIRGLPEESGIYTYGYDEFGQNLYRNQGQIQPFGYTGYQSDRIAETYYAQAREYRAELGRFAGVDIIKGFAAAPYTLNEYGYCYNMPLKYFDKSGNIPEEKAQEIISKNSEYIIKYAEMYDVDPYVVAGCIYVEQVTNVDWIDSLDSTIAIKTDLDTSIGVGQVKVSTARLLEDEEKSICYVAAYLRYQTDIWEKEYPEITEDVALFIFRPYYSVNSLTKKYADEFSELYRDNGFYEDIEYLKVFKYRNEEVNIQCLNNKKLKNRLNNLNDDYAVVLYIEKNHSSASLFIFYDVDGQWELLDWYLVWSYSGTADGFMWPYYL